MKFILTYHFVRYHLVSFIACAFQWVEQVVLYIFSVNTVIISCYNGKTDIFPYLIPAVDILA